MRAHKIMKIWTLSLLCIVMSCIKSNPTQEEIEQKIITLERKALDKWSKGDPVGFSENFAIDATYFDDIAAHGRVDSIEEISKYFKSLDGKIPAHKYELVDPKVQLYGDIAILTLRYNGTSLNNESGPPWKTTSVYRLVDDTWKVVHANWSLIKEQE